MDGRFNWWVICLTLASFGDRSLTGVSGQLTVSLDRFGLDEVFEGDTVSLRCTVVGLEDGGFIEWSRAAGDAESLVARDGNVTDPRYTVYMSLGDAEGTRSEVLDVAGVGRQDTGVYYCHARSSTPTEAPLQTGEVALSVLYFPSENPACTPNGPFAVHVGETVAMSCSSERGNPLVQLHMVTSGAVYVWSYSHDQQTAANAYNLTADPADEGNVIKCSITSGENFPTATVRSCSMGPITVLGPAGTDAPDATGGLTASTVAPTAEGTEAGGASGTTRSSGGDQPPCTPAVDTGASPGSSPCGETDCSPAALANLWADATLWIIVAASVLALLFVSAFVNVVLAVRLRHALARLKRAARQVREHPYMELDPRSEIGSGHGRRKPAKKAPVQYCSTIENR